MKICIKLRKSAKEIFDMIKQVYRDAALNTSNFVKWHKLLRQGRKLIQDGERAHHHYGSTNVNKVMEAKQL